MKTKILAVLKREKDKYVSGEELSKSMQVSRTAVWKAVNTLRQEGYEIESSPRLGYRLRSVFDLLIPSEIEEGLQTKFMGKSICFEFEIDSTNRAARELAEK